jgi:drug/metabolite transporter (DMT)-like permease
LIIQEHTLLPATDCFFFPFPQLAVIIPAHLTDTDMRQTPPANNPLISILSGATFISLSGIWVAWSNLDPTVSAFYRVFFGTIFLFIGCLWRKELHKVDSKSTFLVLLCGLSFAADLVCWHASINYIGPGLSTVIGNFQVFILTFISIIVFGERLTTRFIISVPLAVLGLFLVIGLDWKSLPDNYLFGIVLALLTALLYSVFLLSMRQLQANQPHVSSFYNLMIVSCITSLLLVPTILFSGASFRIPTISSFGAVVCLALFSQTIGWVLIANSLPKVIPSIAGLLLLLQPALAFIWDVLIFDRYTTLLNWIGLAVVLMAIYLGMTSSRKTASIE